MSKLGQQDIQDLIRLREALDQSAYTARLDQELRFLAINDGFLRALGRSQQAIQGCRLQSLLAPEMSPGLADDMHRTLSLGLNWRGELCFASEAGQKTWAEANIIPLGTAAQPHAYFKLIAFDTSERKAVEAARAADQAFIDTMLDCAPAGCFLANAAGDCIYINRQWMALAGLRLGQAIGKGWLDAVHPEDKPTVLACWERLIHEGEPFQLEYRYLLTSGLQHWVMASGVRIRSEQKAATRFLRVEQDMTLQKASDRLIEEQKAKILYAAKLSALGEMAGGIAHEINNPLTVVCGAASRALQLLDTDPGAVRTKLEMIASSGYRIARVIKLMHQLASGEEGPLEKTDLATLLEDVLSVSSQRLKAQGIRLTVEQAAEPINLLCRRAQLYQSLLNLVHNAADAVDACSDKWIHIRVTDLGTTIKIEISDSGPGIDPSLRAKIFQPFFTTKPPGSGMGLGLSVSRKFIERHGGSLTLDTAAPRTCFVLEIPKQAVMNQGQEPQAQKEPANDEHHEKE